MIGHKSYHAHIMYPKKDPLFTFRKNKNVKRPRTSSSLAEPVVVATSSEPATSALVVPNPAAATPVVEAAKEPTEPHGDTNQLLNEMEDKTNQLLELVGSKDWSTAVCIETPAPEPTTVGQPDQESKDCIQPSTVDLVKG